VRLKAKKRMVDERAELGEEERRKEKVGAGKANRKRFHHLGGRGQGGSRVRWGQGENEAASEMLEYEAARFFTANDNGQWVRILMAWRLCDLVASGEIGWVHQK
jgi:hypothetical protein